MTLKSSTEIVSTRIFNAPRDLVFKAWADPELLALWWGPKGFTNTFDEFDFRPGGTWRFVMHGPDGTDYKNVSVFGEILKPQRIVFRHLTPIHQFQATATFEDLDEKTNLTFQMLFDSADECEKVRAFIVDANEQNFDRLEELLKKSGKSRSRKTKTSG